MLQCSLDFTLNMNNSLGEPVTWAIAGLDDLELFTLQHLYTSTSYNTSALAHTPSLSCLGLVSSLSTNHHRPDLKECYFPTTVTTCHPFQTYFSFLGFILAGALSRGDLACWLCNNIKWIHVHSYLEFLYLLLWTVTTFLAFTRIKVRYEYKYFINNT